MDNAIEVEGLEKAYKQTWALKNISFRVKQGEIFGFLGPSGSGKTTTVKILTSQLLYSSGTVRVLGAELPRHRDPGLLSKIGVLTDNSGMYERMSVFDNLALYCKLYGVPVRIVRTVLEQVNMVHDEQKPVNRLSKGMKQRVTLARAMLHEPELLFLDEPTSALDPMNANLIHDALRKLNRKGTTIFLTTHNMTEAETLCGRVAFLNEGEISALDTPANLRLQYADRTITVATPGGSLVVGQDAEGARRIHELMRTGQLLTIHSNEPTLGDIFIRLTGRGLE